MALLYMANVLLPSNLPRANVKRDKILICPKTKYDAVKDQQVLEILHKYCPQHITNLKT